MTVIFCAGVVVGWISLAVGLGLLIGAAARIADAHEAKTEQPEPEPLYVPGSWVL